MQYLLSLWVHPFYNNECMLSWWHSGSGQSLLFLRLCAPNFLASKISSFHWVWPFHGISCCGFSKIWLVSVCRLMTSTRYVSSISVDLTVKIELCWLKLSVYSNFLQFIYLACHTLCIFGIILSMWCRQILFTICLYNCYSLPWLLRA